MANQYIYDLSDTWNSGATTFDAIKMNVTNSASAADSTLLKLQVGGNDKFTVGKGGDATLTSDDAGTSAGPVLSLYRNSGTPVAADILGKILFQGEDSAGNTEDYAEVYASIGDTTSTSEDGSLLLRSKVAGTMTTLATLNASGLTLGSNVPIVFAGTGAATTRTNMGVPAIAGTNTFTGANTFTKTQTWTKGSDVASANALTLGDGNYFDITGTTSITSIGTKGVGTVIKLHFDAALTLTHHATGLILPGAANITTAAGDEAEFVEYATGDWRCLNYQRASGLPLAFIDEDDMTSDSATKVPSQQSVKAYVDTEIAANASAWTYATPQATTSGTAFDFTGIPTGTSEIEVVLEGCSLSGTDNYLVQIGDAGGFETTGYSSASGYTAASVASTAGFILRSADAGNTIQGILRLARYDSTGVDWVSSHGAAITTTHHIAGGGTKTLSAELTQVRLTRTGTNTFDAGQVSLRYR